MKKIKTTSNKVIIKPYKPNHCVLGLDCSSSVLGFGLIDPDNEELMAYGYYNLASSKYDLLERLDYLYNIISSLCKEFMPKSVVIEDIIKHMAGRSSASTIISLTSFNRTAALSAYHNIGPNVYFLNVSTIRSIIKKKKKLESRIMKEDMPNVIRNYLYSELKDYNKKKGTGITDQSFDQADGIAVCWSFILNGQKV